MSGVVRSCQELIRSCQELPGVVRIVSGVVRIWNFHHLCFPMLRICKLRSAFVRRHQRNLRSSNAQPHLGKSRSPNAQPLCRHRYCETPTQVQPTVCMFVIVRTNVCLGMLTSIPCFLVLRCSLARCMDIRIGLLANLPCFEGVPLACPDIGMPTSSVLFGRPRNYLTLPGHNVEFHKPSVPSTGVGHIGALGVVGILLPKPQGF